MSEFEAREKLDEDTVVRDQSAIEYQLELRENSCYLLLRTVVAVLTVLSQVVAILVGIASIVQGFDQKNVWVLMFGMAIIVLGVLLIMALKQAVLLLIDIADTQLDTNRKKVSVD